MTAYRLRLRPEENTTDHWWEFLIGKSRTLADLQAVLNETVGLSNDHLWFFGEKRKYFESSVKYESPGERSVKEGTVFETIETNLGIRSGRRDAAVTRIEDLGLNVGDEFCYLHNYLQSQSFYLTLEAVDESVADHHPTEFVGQSNQVVP